VNVDFWSQVLQAVSIKPMDFALGAAMLTTHTRLNSVGGFAALSDHLADDYELGNRLARAGAGIILSPEIVECRSARLSLKEVWGHQLRWARTIKVCRPFPAFCSILGNASLWPLLWMIADHSLITTAAAGGCLLVRLLGAALLEHRFTGCLRANRWGMAIVKDLLQVFLWTLAFAGKQVTWRGARYRVEEGGRIIPLFELEAK
jgi:ceramide glucosyltransferase